MDTAIIVALITVVGGGIMQIILQHRGNKNLGAVYEEIKGIKADVRDVKADIREIKTEIRERERWLNEC